VAGAVERQGLSETSGLRGQLRSAAKAMEDELKMWPNAAPLMMPMLQMRLAEKNFMIYGGDEHVGQHRRYANQFDLALDGSPLPASTREEFTRMLSAYGSGMAGFVDGTTQLHEHVTQLRARFAAMQPILQKAFTLARLGMSKAITEQEEERRATSRLTAGVGLVAAVSFILAALVLAHSVTRPVRRIQGAMERLAAGDHSVQVPGISRRDEIGDMAKAVAVFKENAIQMVRMQQKQQEIRLEAETVNRMRMAALADNFESAVKDVAEQVSTQALAIRATAEGMATRGEAGDSRSLSVAEAAESSRRSVAAVAEAAEELAGSVQDISFRVAESSHIVEDAVAELARANRRVSGLAEVAGDIDRVVKMISDIAQRTNMLSLNATIEAQRAGEAGKGFAVVAEEVRHLAHQTAASTAEIARQVAAIKSATGDTVDAMADIGSAITRMDQIAGQVAAAVNRQAEVTDKIGRCVDEVRRETHLVTDGVVSVTQSAARYCGAAVRVLWAADDLSRPAGTLKAEVDGFLKTVRAS
jgi:methyl-accepting chemotaxis protein